MRCLLPFLAVAWFVRATIFAQLPALDPPRQWTVTGGQPFQASVVSFDGTTIVFRLANGSHAQAPATRFSTEDTAYLAEWQKKQPIKIVLPETVGVDAAQLKAEVVSEDPSVEKFVYRTTHFEFESQGKFTTSLLREVARSFEATYELVKVLPWDIEPKPASGEYFRARLLKDRAAYHAAGGPANSGGVYMAEQDLFLVPFENIGVKAVGKSYAKTEDFETHTMVHELTHQMMQGSLRLLPMWIVEGTAEYTGTLPLHTGRFRLSAAKNGLKDYVNFLKTRVVDGVPTPYPLDQLFGVDYAKWSSILAQDPRMSGRLYFTSYLLVYYFMHLDGKGDGQNFAHYFREVAEQQREVTHFREEVEDFKKQPGVEVSASGGLRVPKGVSVPKRPAVLATEAARDEFQKRTLKILLDGRSEAELTKQIQSAYVRLGLRF